MQFHPRCKSNISHEIQRWVVPERLLICWSGARFWKYSNCHEQRSHHPQPSPRADRARPNVAVAGRADDVENFRRDRKHVILRNSDAQAELAHGQSDLRDLGRQPHLQVGGAFRPYFWHSDDWIQQYAVSAICFAWLQNQGLDLRSWRVETLARTSPGKPHFLAGSCARETLDYCSVGERRCGDLGYIEQCAENWVVAQSCYHQDFSKRWLYRNRRCYWSCLSKRHRNETSGVIWDEGTCFSSLNSNFSLRSTSILCRAYIRNDHCIRLSISTKVVFRA